MTFHIHFSYSQSNRALRSNDDIVLFLILVLSIAVLAIDRKSKHIESLLVKDWLCDLRPFEYEYRFTE